MPKALWTLVALLCVATSVVMVTLGWPEQSPAQSVLLELSALPLSGAVAVAIWVLYGSALRPLGSRSRAFLLVGAGAVLLGVAFIGLGYLVGPRDLVHPGQALIWLGLLGGLLVMAANQPRRTGVEYELREDADSDFDQDDLPDSESGHLEGSEPTEVD